MSEDLTAAVEDNVSSRLERRGKIRTDDYLDIPQEARQEIERAGCLSQKGFGVQVFADVSDENGDVSVVVDLNGEKPSRLVHAAGCAARGVLDTLEPENYGRDGGFAGTIDEDARMVVTLANDDLYRFVVEPEWGDDSHPRIAAKVAASMERV